MFASWINLALIFDIDTFYLLRRLVGTVSNRFEVCQRFHIRVPRLHSGSQRLYPFSDFNVQADISAVAILIVDWQ